MSWEQQPQQPVAWQPPAWQPPAHAAAVGPPPAATEASAPPVRSRGGPLALGAALLVVGVIFAATALVRPLQGVRSTVARLHELLAKGDLATLRSERALGASRWADSVVREHGQVEFNAVVAIYDRAEQAGAEEFGRLQSAVNDGGQRAYDALGSDQRRGVDRQSHDAWVLPEGYRSIPEAAGAGALAVIFQNPSDPALTQRLGTAALSAAERAQLADRPDTDPAVQGDRGLARIAQKRAQRGARALDQLRQRIVSTGEHAFRRLDRATRGSIDRRSHWEFINQQGMASLSPADRARVGDAGVFQDEARAAALRGRLGLERLAPEERRRIERVSRAAFLEQHDLFVEREGMRLGTAALIARYRGSRYELHDVRVSGQGSRDLVRRRSAHAAVRWSASGPGALLLLGGVNLAWDAAENRWRVVALQWQAPAASGEATAEDPS
jgi:hypothetical protein